MITISTSNTRALGTIGRFLATWILLVLAGAPFALAQGTRVEGVVRDATNAVVPGAQVELHAKSYSSQKTTDASGAYAFDGVPETTGTIAISADGFQRVQQTWTASGSAPVRIDVVLQPSVVSQKVVVTAARAPTRLNETPLSDIQLTRDDLEATPALTLDDSLRQVPGFSLFRRSSSRIANPTTMGLSLRGLGSGSGTSRAVVLEDGIPLTDPFGSWVYWDRVPTESVSSIEVAQEGASSLYGSSALGGVVQFLTRPAHPAGISLETSYGNQNTPDFSLWAGGQAGKWESTFGGELFHTDGYVLVPEADRGSVDTRAGSQHGSADWMIGRKIGQQSEIFARGWYLDDTRKNGTPKQNNGIRLAQGALGANLQLGEIGALTLRFYGEAETYHQTFSSVLTGRNKEILTDQQAVPAQGVGGSAVWTRNLGKRQTLVAGFDEHEEIGHSNENLFSGVSGKATKNTFSGGHQRTIGVFGEDMIQIAPRWMLSLSARFDNWRNFDAFLACVPTSSPSPCNPPLTQYADRSYDAFSPRATLIHEWNPHISWSASVYRAFRAPTLNELYRSFRQGTVTTDSNPDLRSERLTGGETGIDVKGLNQRLELRGTFFFNEVVNPVSNVPCAVPPATPTPNCPLASTGTTQQRQNLGRTSAPGFEIDGVANITTHTQLIAGYQYVDATVLSSPAITPTLAGNWVAQIPHNVVTFQARYTNPRLITASLEGRMVGMQFDDASNQAPMDRFFVLDAMASRSIGAGVEVFASAENLFNEKYLFAVQGVPELGLPIAARFGFRVQFPKR
ncbi:MAG TPA: TonB-dependent receptor [Candidatus Acidoferrales bacterium]|nr:TonB-dependent receptor [Candidatus Acidoferrales bacterium]